MGVDSRQSKRNRSTTTRSIVVEQRLEGFDRADLVFEGVEQGGSSFEARVFVNNPHADERTARTLDCGYAGAFHVYGYGQRPPGSARPITKRLTATAAVREALTRAPELTVTVVPVPASPGPHFTDVRIVFDPAL
jgi:hypothetical protein